MIAVTLFLPALLIAWAPTEPPAVQPAIQQACEEIGALVAGEWKKDERGSVTIGLVVRADLVWTKSYGLADMEQKVPATRETVYRIGSITKQFTGLMLLQMLEAEKIHLADPVEKYFPEVNQLEGRYAYAPPITLVQLATMTAGINTEPYNLPLYLKGPVSDWEKVLISALPHTRYVAEPGTRFLYSNIGYAILGATLGRAAGQPYTEYVQQRILAPLGMKHTAFELNADLRAHLAKGYDVKGSKIDAETPEREHLGRGFKVPNGALYTTVDDLARFVAFELSEGPPSVLKKETLNRNFSRVYSSDADLASGYGIGFSVFREGNRVIFGHSGGVAGYTAVAFIHRPSHTGVIVLRNVSGGRFDMGRLATRALEKLAAGNPAKSR
jgi:CubicO group peptidase (beta-lactamase class C family)